MTGEPRPWPPAQLDTPRRRFTKGTWRDFLGLLPWIAVVIVAGATLGRWAGLAGFALLLAMSTARLVVTGSTPAQRRAGIRFVRLGTGAEPERWRLAAYRLGPVLLLVPLVVGSSTGSDVVFYPVLLAYVGFWIFAFIKARPFGLDADPMLTLAGLDVWWAGDPPTPSGTSEPPAGGPPRPTPGAPPTPAPAPRPGSPEPR